MGDAVFAQAKTFPINVRIKMVETLYGGSRYVVTANAMSCLVALVFALDHQDTPSWLLLLLTILAGIVRMSILQAYRIRVRDRPLEISECKIWSRTFAGGAIFLALCVALSIFKAYQTPGIQGADEQVILFALSLGLTTGTAQRWAVPPWTAIGTAMIVMPALAYANIGYADKHHILASILAIGYLGIILISIKNSCAEFAKSVNATQEVERLATRDDLTGLLNRLGFGRAFLIVRERAGAPSPCVSILLLDLDRFKIINDLHGHAAGDALLVEVGRCLKECTREGQTIARFGGDEFAILYEGQPANAQALAARIVERLCLPFLVLGKELEIGSSIGVFSCTHSNLDEMLSRADFALYKAKNSGRNQFVTFLSEMGDEIDAKRALEASLRGAISRKEMFVEYQPLVDLASREYVGVEALVRWQHPSLGCVPPSVFIPLAEELGIVGEVGEWVLETACAEVVTWAPHIHLAVNLSPAQFAKGNLTGTVFRILSKTGFPPSRLELEITEGAVIVDNENTRCDLDILRSHGVRISLDDFGTGWSGIGYLREFTFDKLKIDRSFIASCPANARALELIRGIISLAHGLGLPVVAEGVETVDQVALLEELRCSQVQGFLFGHPMQAEIAKSLMVGRRAKPKLTLVGSAG